MTAGEKINFYRKKLGLSQEELGQKLLVSRQTISLWEKGQTVPTIDNLIRLKEIFGVSVDEILGVQDDIANEKETENKDEPDLHVPNETYCFKYSKKDIDFINRHTTNKPILQLIIILAIAVLGVFLIPNDNGGLTIGSALTLGILIASILFLIFMLYTGLKNSKVSKQEVMNSLYKYNVYNDYFTVTIEGEKSTLNSKFRFDDIDQFMNVGDYLLIVIKGRYYVLRKHSLAPKSVFIWLANGNLNKKTIDYTKGVDIQKIVLVILFVATLFSLFIATGIGALLSVGSYGVIPNNMFWSFIAPLPIPLASLILGIIYKRKGYKCKKNIVAGIIFTILLCIYGAISYTAEDVYDHSDTPIIKTEEKLEIDIPEHKQINTQDWTTFNQSINRGYIHYTSDVYFEDSQVIEFEKEIQDNTMWLSVIPNNLIGIMSPLSETSKGEYCLVYNTITKELNTLPKENGTYRFLYVRYNPESNIMRIEEYNTRYIK